LKYQYTLWRIFSIRELISLSPSFSAALSFLGTSHPAEPLREASQAAPLCGWAHGSQRYKEAPPIFLGQVTKYSLRDRPYGALKRGPGSNLHPFHPAWRG